MATGDTTVVLRSAELEATITPDQGADIVGLVDRASGVDVFFHPPWAPREGGHAPPYGSTTADWLARYRGGWQLLVPHAGPEREVDGVLRGYHGEAALAAWTTSAHDPDRVELGVDLFTAPLRLTRTIHLDGATLSVSDTVTNLSDVPVHVAWVQHPAFGPPFAGPRCTFATNARTLVADPTSPGTVFGRGQHVDLGQPVTAEGAPARLEVLPDPSTRQEVFGALTDFDGDSAWASLTNHDLGFGVRLAWDTDVLPYAWFWQECQATAGFPWFRRAYAVGLEPANVLTGFGPHVPQHDAPQLAPHQARTARLTLTRFDTTR